MFKRTVSVILIMLCMFTLPLEAWAGPAQDIEAREAAKDMESTVGQEYIGTKYANAEVGIYEWPDETAKLLDTSRINTTFEVITEKNGWSLITTYVGYAYIKSEFLQDAQIPETPVFNYSEEDLYILAHVLSGEAQNCPDEEQLYVGSVVLNRRLNPQFPNTIKGVVFQKGQYACTWDGNYYREPTERNWANAKKLLEEGSVLPSNVIWQSSKKQGKGVYIKTKWHYFCY